MSTPLVTCYVRRAVEKHAHPFSLVTCDTSLHIDSDGVLTNNGYAQCPLA